MAHLLRTDIELGAKRNKVHHHHHHLGAALFLNSPLHHAPTLCSLCIPSYNLFKKRLQMGRGASETEEVGVGVVVRVRKVGVRLS